MLVPEGITKRNSWTIFPLARTQQNLYTAKNITISEGTLIEQFLNELDLSTVPPRINLSGLSSLASKKLISSSPPSSGDTILHATGELFVPPAWDGTQLDPLLAGTNCTESYFITCVIESSFSSIPQAGEVLFSFEERILHGTEPVEPALQHLSIKQLVSVLKVSFESIFLGCTLFQRTRTPFLFRETFMQHERFALTWQRQGAYTAGVETMQMGQEKPYSERLNKILVALQLEALAT